MAREFSKTNLTIWQDPEWRALPWPAQHVYKMFWEHPSLSYCGVADWRPSKMLGWGDGWDRDTFDALVDCLRARYFLVVDEDTEEVLVRSWVRFDGIIRQPRLAVSLTKAFAEVGSNTLRGVIVDELTKLRDREPDAEGWKKPAVLALLDLPSVSAKDEDVPEDPFAKGFTISFGSVSQAFGGNVTSGFASVSDPPTTSTSTSTSQHQPAASADAEREFDEFWNAYPKKRDKGHAVRAYRAARKKADPQAILDGLRRQLPMLEQAEEKFRPYAATWLNGERWADEVTTAPASGDSADWMRRRLP